MQPASHLEVTDQPFTAMVGRVEKAATDLGYQLRDTLLFGDLQQVKAEGQSGFQRISSGILSGASEFTQSLERKFSQPDERSYWSNQVEKLHASIDVVKGKAKSSLMLVVVGNGNCGKSTFLNALVGSPSDLAHRLFNIDMGQCTSWRWVIVLKPEITDNFEVIVKSKKLEKNKEVERERTYKLNSREELIKIVQHFQKNPLDQSGLEDATSLLHDKSSSSSDEDEASFFRIQEIEIKIRDQDLLQHRHKLFTKSIGVLDLPGIDEFATQVEIRAYLEVHYANVLPVLIVNLTSGGFNHQTQFISLSKILQRVEQPQTVIFTFFEKHAKSIDNEVNKLIDNGKLDEDQYQVEYEKRLRDSISLYSSKLKQILGKDTNFFIYDPFFEQECYYNFENLSDPQTQKLGAASAESALNISCDLQFETRKSRHHSITDLKPILAHFNSVLNSKVHSVKETQANRSLVRACRDWLKDSEKHFDAREAQGEEADLYKAFEIIKKNVTSIKQAYLDKGKEIIAKDVEKFREVANKLIEDGDYHKDAKTFDSKDFHIALVNKIAVEFKKQFDETDKKLKDQVINLMATDLEKLSQPIFDLFRSQKQLEEIKSSEENGVAVQKLAFSHIYEAKEFWTSYNNDMEGRMIDRQWFNLGRYGVLWGRRKDCKKYLIKIKMLFEDQNKLNNQLEQFEQSFADFCNKCIQLAQYELEALYRKFSGQDANYKQKRLELIYSIYFNQASQIIEKFERAIK